MKKKKATKGSGNSAGAKKAWKTRKMLYKWPSYTKDKKKKK
jgi:hypothetical protein